MACGRVCLPMGAGVDLTSGEGASFLFPSAVHAMAGSLLFFSPSSPFDLFFFFSLFFLSSALRRPLFPPRKATNPELY